jgi:hypothetical protein
VSTPKPPPVKLPCSAGGHKAKLSPATGLLKSHSHGGAHCNGSGKPPAHRRDGSGWTV